MDPATQRTLLRRALRHASRRHAHERRGARPGRNIDQHRHCRRRGRRHQRDHAHAQFGGHGTGRPGPDGSGSLGSRPHAGRLQRALRRLESQSDAPIVVLMQDVYTDLYGQPPRLRRSTPAWSAARSAPCIRAWTPSPSGPTLYDVHTPAERLEVASVEKVYNLVLETLVRIAAQDAAGAQT
ncbi:MAG: hypothetical protein R2838_26150 [Caldilineaceae bacterium]